MAIARKIRSITEAGGKSDSYFEYVVGAECKVYKPDGQSHCNPVKVTEIRMATFGIYYVFTEKGIIAEFENVPVIVTYFLE